MGALGGQPPRATWRVAFVPSAFSSNRRPYSREGRGGGAAVGRDPEPGGCGGEIFFQRLGTVGKIAFSFSPGRTSGSIFTRVPNSINGEVGDYRVKNRDIHCAKKLGKGGSDVRIISETFRRNPAGNQSRLVEPGQQPEASLASCGATHGAKRRQRVLMPCD